MEAKTLVSCGEVTEPNEGKEEEGGEKEDNALYSQQRAVDDDGREGSTSIGMAVMPSIRITVDPETFDRL